MKKLISLFMAIMCIFAFGGCGKVIDQGNDGTKQKILISVYDGGYGTKWLEEMTAKFNATNKEYIVDFDGGSKKDANQVLTEISSGTKYDMYIGNGNIQLGIYNDLLVDLSDVVERVSDGKSIKDKMNDYEGAKSLFSKNNAGLYAIPYTYSTNYGMIYDHDFFLSHDFLKYAELSEKSSIEAQGITVKEENGKLIFVSSSNKVNYEADDAILSAGKDGKYGTYDDGQAITVEEFDALIKKIDSTTHSFKTYEASIDPFIYSGVFHGAVEDFVYDYVVQTEGIDAIKGLMQFDSNGYELELIDGTKSAITVENANQVIKKSKSLKEGLTFVQDYFYNDEYRSATTKGNTSHTDAQQNYLYGAYGINKSLLPAAFLFDGDWWENEARGKINELVDAGEISSYGETDYRYYLLPSFKGETKTAINVSDALSIYIPKKTDTKKIDVVKDFIASMFTDENLKIFTKDTGVLLQYDYELTESDLAGLSKFARNNIEMLRDTENIITYSTRKLMFSTPMRFASSLSYISFATPTFVDNIEYLSCPQPLYNNKTVEETLAGVMNYSDEDWAKALSEVKKGGFYA